MMAAGHNILHRRGNEKGTLTLTSKSLVVVFLIKMQRNRTRLEWVKKKVYNLVSIKFQCSQHPLNCVAHICWKGYTLVLLSKYTDSLFNQLFIDVLFLFFQILESWGQNAQLDLTLCERKGNETGTHQQRIGKSKNPNNDEIRILYRWNL